MQSHKRGFLRNDYLNAFLDNDKVETGKCRILCENFPNIIMPESIPFVKRKGNYYYYYWNLVKDSNFTDDHVIEEFEQCYKESKFRGILQALKSNY